jgi:hypothetical protein
MILRVLSSGIHGVMSQKIVVFITTAVRTTDPVVTLLAERLFLRDVMFFVAVTFNIMGI